MILHSSGSTSFPKPITYTLFTYLSVFRSLLFGDESVLGWTAFIGHLPPFHAMAFQWGLAVCLGSGLTNGLRDPRFVKVRIIRIEEPLFAFCPSYLFALLSALFSPSLLQQRQFYQKLSRFTPMSWSLCLHFTKLGFKTHLQFKSSRGYEAPLLQEALSLRK